MRPWHRRKLRRIASQAALLEFQMSSIKRPEPTAAIASLHVPVKPRRLTWTERAKMELEEAMLVDLEPDRKKRQKHVPAYDRIAEHLRQKGFS